MAQTLSKELGTLSIKYRPYWNVKNKTQNIFNQFTGKKNYEGYL